MDSVKTIACTSCAAPIQIRGLGRTATCGCSYCGAILDIESEDLKIVSEAKKIIAKLKIPLGSRGVFNGITYELIGHIRRTDAHTEFFWSEYLLFNPYYGFRWLSEFSNHWQFVTPLPYVPDIESTHAYKGHNYRLFSRGLSVVHEVSGELYWQVRRGDKSIASDYISPPRGVSIEEERDEISASEFSYISFEEVQKAFRLSGKQALQSPVGVSLTQVNAHKINIFREMSFYAFIFCFICIYQVYSVQSALNKLVHKGNYVVLESAASDAIIDYSSAEALPVFVGPFTLLDKVSNVELQMKAQVDNSWLYAEVELASIDGSFKDEKNIEISYYHGYDSEGSWYEGGTKNSVRFSSVPPGEYQMVVTPQIPRGIQIGLNYPKAFEVSIMQDVPYWGNFLVALLILSLFPIYKMYRIYNFENRRWEESSIDYDLRL